VPAPVSPATHAQAAPDVRAFFGDRSCHTEPREPAAITCEIAGVAVEARLVGDDARREYAARSQAHITPRRGAPACALGRDDERAWSRPSTPAVAAGRYRCRIEHGRAAMWWTDEHGIVAHAVARDGNLARLFAWWRAHREG